MIFTHDNIIGNEYYKVSLVPESKGHIIVKTLTQADDHNWEGPCIVNYEENKDYMGEDLVYFGGKSEEQDDLRKVEKATEAEALWLEACMKQGHYMDFQDATGITVAQEPLLPLSFESKPIATNEIKKGGIYVYGEDRSYLFKAKDDKNNYMTSYVRVTDKKYSSNYNSSLSGTLWTASKEQVAHHGACTAAGKYVDPPARKLIKTKEDLKMTKIWVGNDPIEIRRAVFNRFNQLGVANTSKEDWETFKESKSFYIREDNYLRHSNDDTKIGRTASFDTPDNTSRREIYSEDLLQHTPNPATEIDPELLLEMIMGDLNPPSDEAPLAG